MKSEFDCFVSLVYEMRNKQKEYFKTRSFQLLREVKELEKAVDAKIKELHNKQTVCEQQELF